jgi:hypothetical protein
MPLVEIGYTGLFVVKVSMEAANKRYETYHSANEPLQICNSKQNYYSDVTISKIMTLNKIRYNPATSFFVSS